MSHTQRPESAFTRGGNFDSFNYEQNDLDLVLSQTNQIKNIVKVGTWRIGWKSPKVSSVTD